MIRVVRERMNTCEEWMELRLRGVVNVPYDRHTCHHNNNIIGGCRISHLDSDNVNDRTSYYYARLCTSSNTIMLNIFSPSPSGRRTRRSALAGAPSGTVAWRRGMDDDNDVGVVGPGRVLALKERSEFTVLEHIILTSPPGLLGFGGSQWFDFG